MEQNPVNIRTVVRFESAHRQYLDPSKCGRLHGHNWKAEVEIYGIPDSIGYVIDFKDIKENIVAKFDHKTILAKNDPLVDILRNADQLVATVPFNPTCENLSLYIKQKLQDVMTNPDDPEYGPSIKVRVWENEESYAEA